MNFTFAKVFAILAFALFAATSSLRAEESVIRFGWGWTIWGSGYWTIYPNDRMTYEGRFYGAQPKMKGWQWKPRYKREEGIARFRNKGAYQRARLVVGKALQDPILMNPPDFQPECFDAGFELVWIASAPDPTFALDRCMDSSGELNYAQKRYLARFEQFFHDLHGALGTHQLIPKQP